jgi:hypothetical protein
MPSLKIIASSIFLISLIVLPASYAATFQEQNGIVVMEVESSPANGSWNLERALGGYSGNGYYIWRGTDAFAKSTAGRGTITYTFKINTAGNYQMRWRSRIGKGTSRTEHNDSWIQFPTGRDISGEQALNGWTKVFMNTRDSWVWQSATVDNVGRPVRQFFSAGVHTVQISGRSSGHAIDRIALYKYDSVSYSESKFNALPNSGTTGNTTEITPVITPEPTPVVVEPEPITVITPEPTPVVIPDPTPIVIPEPLPVVETTPTNVAAPVVSVSQNTISWNAVDAIAINVHRGSGEWLESLPSSQTQWQAPSAGAYYLVATGEGSWETWGRSETVSVTAALDTAALDNSPVAASTLASQVYSSTAIELFWDKASDSEVSYEVRRDDQLLTVNDGRSYYDEGLSPGTRYNYNVTALNTAGDTLWTQGASVSTLGGSTDNTTAVMGTARIELRAETYSQSAVEIFWNTDLLDASRIYNFDVYFNGQLVKTTDGRSYFQEGLTAGTDYQFSVTAVASDSSIATSDEITVRTYEVDAQ